MRIIHTCLAFIALTVAASQSTLAEELKLAIGHSLAPYVFTETNSGMELDIVKDALAIVGYTAIPIYVPSARRELLLRGRKVDGALTVSESSGLEDVHYSDPYITYQNVAATLKKNDYRIETVEDLSGKTILGFQTATKYLGASFQKAVEKSPDYRELANQAKQVELLFRERTQVIVLDINIFLYHKQRIKGADVPVVIHRIFPETPYKVGFLDAEVRDQFNKGLKELRENGRYVEIVAKYVQ